MPKLPFIRSRWLWLASALLMVAAIAAFANLASRFNERSEVIATREDAMLLPRPFQRLQREILNLTVIVAGNNHLFTSDDLQLQRDITTSRFFDLNANINQRRVSANPDLKAIQTSAEEQWATLQIDLDAYQTANLNDPTLEASLLSQLDTLELTVNQTDNIHTIRLDELGQSLEAVDDELLRAQLLTALLFISAIMLIAATIIVQLQRFNRQVEVANQALQERTEQLAKTNQELEYANSLKSQFLATMSHELRTPMNSILGFTSLLLMGIRGELTDSVKDALNRIEASGKHLLQLINDILDIAKIESGRLELVEQPFDLRDLVDAWSQRLKVLADNKGLEFKTQVDPTMPNLVLGDQERLTQIANNLLSNAIKFTDNGQVMLKIQPNSTHWMLQVTDTGKGIPTEAQEYIFDEFRQVDGSYNRTQGGTGLGLAIVRKLAQAMGGTIQLESQLGVGSTFRVTLPLKEPATPLS